MPKGSIKVSGYTRSNGVRVKGYTRSAPSKVHVSGYTKSDGTRVKSHYRSMPHITKSGKSFIINTNYQNNNNFMFQNIVNTQNNIGKKDIDTENDNKKIIVIYPELFDEEKKSKVYCSIGQHILMIPSITNCNHIFDQNNIREWIKHNDTCPLCRTEIYEINDLEADHEIMKLLKIINIKFDKKIYSYTEFMKKHYLCDDDIEIITDMNDTVENIENIKNILIVV
jgi:hypothetical protein